MTERAQDERHRAFYDAAATSVTEITVMNYGYAPENPPIESPVEGRAAGQAAGQPGSEYFCLELYRHVGRPAIAGGRVLEVSCGRGGGAFFVMQTFEPTELIGIDLSAENVRLANERFAGIDGLEFRVGNAEELAFADESFDAVLNVEASHLYGDPPRFFAEVARILRPGGLFLYADLFWRDSDPESMLTQAGLVVRQSRDVTPNVLRSLELDSERREALVEPGMPEAERREFRDWAGIKGYRAYNRFASGEWIYRSFELSRP